MIRVTLMDGSTLELAKDLVREVLPTSKMIRSPHLRSDVLGLVPYHGQLLPIFSETTNNTQYESAPYVVILSNKCILSANIPEILFETESNSTDFREEDWEDEIDKLVA
ncbi:MAG: hypothetical protein M9962_06860 [Oligoflexia bacterium]|nr:hypothetical protein [Oligoflexia bacterium]